MARQPFSSSMSDVMDPYGAFRGTPSRKSLPTAYYFLRSVLVAGALAGGIVALYRNDVFLELARRSGQEHRYLEFEKFFLGTPGWGTPRSMQPVLAGTAEATPAEASAPVAAVTADPVTPAPVVAAPTPTPEPQPQVAQAAPTSAPAPAPVAASPAAKPIDPLAPVSLESLPLLGAPSRPVPAAAPVALAQAPAPARAPVPAPVSRSSSNTAGTKTRAIAVSLDEPQPAAPARAKPKPEPAAAPEPPPAPVAAKPVPKGPKTTDARPNDNPLLGAIRSAVRARPPSDKVPQ